MTFETATSVTHKLWDRSTMLTRDEILAVLDGLQLQWLLDRMLAAPLAGTRYDPMKAKPNPLGGEDIVPGAELTKALFEKLQERKKGPKKKPRPATVMRCQLPYIAGRTRSTNPASTMANAAPGSTPSRAEKPST